MVSFAAPWLCLQLERSTRTKWVLTRNARLPRDIWVKQRGSACLWQHPKGHPMCSREKWWMLFRAHGTGFWEQDGEQSSQPGGLSACAQCPHKDSQHTVLLASLVFFFRATRDWPPALSPLFQRMVQILGPLMCPMLSLCWPQQECRANASIVFIPALKSPRFIVVYRKLMKSEAAEDNYGNWCIRK